MTARLTCIGLVSSLLLVGCTTKSIDPTTASTGDILRRHKELQEAQAGREAAAADTRRRYEETVKELEAARKQTDERRQLLEREREAAQIAARGNAEEMAKFEKSVDEERANVQRQEQQIEALKQQRDRLQAQLKDAQGMTEQRRQELEARRQTLEQEARRLEEQNALTKKAIEDRLRVYREARQRAMAQTK
jgi:SMC interacting uncharacterized protein involved in chromosome segregation